MQLEDVELKEPIIYDFFSWLFDDDRIKNKEINLKKEIDLPLAPYYKDANIYYPECIANFFETTPMKRLRRVSQLSLAIDEFPNAYHNRLEHCKGTYYRKLEEMIYNFQNHSWKNYIEDNNLKLYLLADLIKVAGHDIGHMPLSHAMEEQIYHAHDAHEIIGKRIMLENSEINSVLTSISPELPNILKQLYDEDILNFKQHDESNNDVDRFDYLSRDNLYFGNPTHIPYQNYETILTENGYIDVYPFSSLKPIEEFLEIRENGYKNAYFSIKTQIRESSINYFIKAFMASDSEYGRDLRQFIELLMNSDLDNLDLDEYLKWDDIRLYDSILDIAENHEDENVRALATMTIPNMKAFLNMIYSHLNLRKLSSSHMQVVSQPHYSTEDKNFLKKIKHIITGNNELSQNLRNLNYASDNIFIDTENSFDESPSENFEASQINDLHILFKSYNRKNPIYLRGLDNKVYELSKHPQRKYDWDKRTLSIDTKYAYIPYLKFQGLTDKEISNLSKHFCTLSTYDYSSKNCKPKFNLQPLQVGHNIEDVFLEQ